MPAPLPQFAARERSHVPPFPEDLAFCGFNKPQYRATKRGLSTAAFSDQSNGFLRMDLEINAVHGLQPSADASEQSAPDREMHAESLNFKEAHGVAFLNLATNRQKVLPRTASVATGHATDSASSGLALQVPALARLVSTRALRIRTVDETGILWGDRMGMAPVLVLLGAAPVGAPMLALH